MSHKIPSNKSRQRVKLFTVHDQEILASLQNPSDEEIREQLLSGPKPNNRKRKIMWAVLLHHTQKTFMGINGHISEGFKIQHQEISEMGVWETTNRELPI